MWLRSYPRPGSVRLRQMLVARGDLVFKPPKFKPEDIAISQYTGGLTGVSKGAMLTHRNVLANVEPSCLWLDPIVNVWVADPRNNLALVKVLARYKFASLPAVSTLFSGLLNDPQCANLAETAALMASDGFLRTRDMAVMEAGGYLKIVDRFKYMILVSGFNLYPNEVEDVVMMHPGLLEVATVGEPSANSGEMVKLFVLRRAPDLTEVILLAHCREQLTASKLPREVEFLAELPKSKVGRLSRRELRERG